MSETSGHFFHDKGIAGEDFVQGLATKTFFTDWCFNNPKWPDNNKELCDLFVVFDDIALIWSVKNCKLDKEGNYKESDIAKSNSQLLGAYRRLFKLKKPITLLNPSGGEEVFCPDTIKQIHLISTLVGEEGVFLNPNYMIDSYHIHVFDRIFLEMVLSELDTISDFCEYLSKKEDLLNTDIGFVVEGGEEEILAHYLLNNKSFNIPTIRKNNFPHGTWDRFINSSDYHSKKKANEISLGWDEIIEKGRENTPESRTIAMVLARPNRLERRVLAKYYKEAYFEAAASAEEFNITAISSNDVTYCFLFFDEPRDKKGLRKQHLRNLLLIGKVTYPENEQVIGIATEKTPSETWVRDFCLKVSWSEKELSHLESLVSKGIIRKPSIRKKNFDPEHPPE